MRMRVFLCVLMGWFVGTIHAQLLPPIYNTLLRYTRVRVRIGKYVKR